MKRRLVFFAMALFGAALPMLANVTYTCDPSIDATQAGTCAALNGSTVSGVYSSVFSNVNANIYITYGAIGAYGESDTGLTTVSYSQYYTHLAGSTDDATALASLSPTSDPLLPYGNTSGNIDVTPTLASALGLTGAETAGLHPDGSSCVLGVDANCYSGIVTISSTSFGSNPLYYPLSPSDPAVSGGIDFFYLVEHETDEVLGTISCIGTSNDNTPDDECNSTDASPADLFRYASALTPSFLTTANGSNAYFSIDGGFTQIAQYTNTPGNGDYGDWVYTGVVKVQDGDASAGVNADITNDGGSEIAVLNAVGFNLATPEPSTFALLGVSLSILGLARLWRRSRRDQP
jgi:hypothetical protein